MKAARRSTLTELLREAVTESESLLGLERETGLKRASLRKFRDGEQNLRLDMADKLCAYFGIEHIRVKKED